jgi:hypothetical protein
MKIYILTRNATTSWVSMLNLCAHGQPPKILVVLGLATIDILKLLLPTSSTSTITCFGKNL